MAPRRGGRGRASRPSKSPSTILLRSGVIRGGVFLDQEDSSHVVSSSPFLKRKGRSHRIIFVDDEAVEGDSNDEAVGEDTPLGNQVGSEEVRYEGIVGHEDSEEV